MESLFIKKVPLYFETEESQLVLGDSFKILTKMEPESVDMIFADPPYFLSNDGITCQGGKMVSVNKGSWDKLSESGTSVEEKHKFNRKWIRLCKKVLKPNGTIWISGTLHNIYSIGMALEQEGFKIINNITWQKTNPPPNLACRCFTHSTETILWARKNDKKSRHFFNYQKMKEMNGGKQMKDVWTGSDKTFGKKRRQASYTKARILAGKNCAGIYGGRTGYIGPFLWFWNYWGGGCTIWTEVYWNRYMPRILGDIEKKIGEGGRWQREILMSG